MPSVRARHLKTKLQLLERWPGGAQALRLLDAAMLAEIREAHGTDWLPVEHDLAITRAVHEALGADSADALWRETLLQEMEGTLFGPITRAALADPTFTQDRWPVLLCKGWQLAFRECGRWAVRSVGPRALDLRLGRLPRACMSDRVWLTSVASALSAVHRFLRNQGTFRMCEVEPPATVLYRSAWGASSLLAADG